MWINHILIEYEIRAKVFLVHTERVHGFSPIPMFLCEFLVKYFFMKWEAVSPPMGIWIIISAVGRCRIIWHEIGKAVQFVIYSDNEQWSSEDPDYLHADSSFFVNQTLQWLQPSVNRSYAAFVIQSLTNN